MRTSALLFVAITCLAAGCSRRDAPTPAGSSGEPAFSREHPRRIVFQSDWFPQAEHGGFYQALTKGYYAEAGLDVELRPGGPGVTNIRLDVARGDAQFGMFRSDNLLLSIVKEDLPLLMVAAVTQHDYEALLVHADSPVKSFADLDGKTIIASPGQAWIGFLERKYAIKFSQVPNKGSLAAFFADPNAIQQCILTNEPFKAQENGVKVRVLSLADAGYDSYTAVFCRADFARANPVATRAFVAATLRGWRDFLEGDPTPAYEEILRRNKNMSPEFLKFSRTEMLAHAINAGNPSAGEALGRLLPARINGEIAMLVSLKMLDAPVPFNLVATQEYLPGKAAGDE